jgi:hypothetical protein
MPVYVHPDHPQVAVDATQFFIRPVYLQTSPGFVNFENFVGLHIGIEILKLTGSRVEVLKITELFGDLYLSHNRPRRRPMTCTLWVLSVQEMWKLEISVKGKASSSTVTHSVNFL